MSDDQTPAEDEFDTPGAEELEALRAEVAALRDQALRYAAEAENTRRRAERDSNDARAFAIQKFARDLLGVADNLDRATQSAPAEAADPAFKNLLVGVEMTARELAQSLERNGVKKVDPAAGDKFDPHFHQAVMEQPSDTHAAGSVIQVLQPGYELFGRILRPAMVVVAAKQAGAGQAASEAYAQNADDAAGGAVDTRA